MEDYLTDMSHMDMPQLTQVLEQALPLGLVFSKYQISEYRGTATGPRISVANAIPVIGYDALVEIYEKGSVPIDAQQLSDLQERATRYG